MYCSNKRTIRVQGVGVVSSECPRYGSNEWICHSYRRVVDRSNTDQEIKAIRGTDSISRRPDLSSAFRYELVISGTIGEYNQTPDRRVIDRSNTDQEIKAISRHQLQKCSKHFVCCPRIIDDRE